MPYIGKDVQERMSLLGLTTEELAEKAFLEKDMISAIIDNKLSLEEIDEFDLSLLCSVLHCQEDFFTDIDVRTRDLLSASLNRGLDNERSINVKAKLQDFMNDFAFVNEVLAEVAGEGN